MDAILINIFGKKSEKFVFEDEGLSLDNLPNENESDKGEDSQNINDQRSKSELSTKESASSTRLNTKGLEKKTSKVTVSFGVVTAKLL